ncbi:uncharacterized protein LOC108892317 [Lates calcarifer]|uniref:Uncharacterized protein LOC108892317 n=1 Tax=Lates calcarifer TaxID=8187 RepID=A0A4W6BY56_LATCA|nr:uncharacterized protein LOC108892317 [Lates calcarifer]XP_018545323.1 uncharacterized protein LOC108892317 [Lates calcarifer]XP_018545324.1 uncharacterized protein LOC108892317 [Lates calcarifer]
MSSRQKRRNSMEHPPEFSDQPPEVVKEELLKTLEELEDEEFDQFKWILQQPEILEGFSDIPKRRLDKANRQETVDQVVQNYNQQSVEVMKKVLKKMNRNDLVKFLSCNTGAQVSPQQTTSHQTSLQSDPQNRIRNKFKDIISKSSLISLGSPALYQLRPKKEKIGNLTRMTVGERNVMKINKTILLVGETGTGKSTLVNALVNYSMGVKFEDNIWFQIVEDEKRRQYESQTPDVIVYEIFGFEDQTLPYSLTIIDTPGYGDTRGIEHDVIVSQRLLDLFSSDDGVHEMNAVGLVMKATDNRLSDRQTYIFNSVVSLFGKNLEKNIIALITHSDGVTPEDALKALEAAKIKCARNEKNQPVHFLFDNCQTKQRTEETDMVLKNAWKVTGRGMSQFTDFLEKSGPQKLMTTVEVLNSRIRLTACINNLQGRIKLIELKQTEITQTQEALKKHEEEMKKNEEFTVEFEEVYKDKEPISGGGWLFYEGAVTCKVCEENCHYPGCTKAWYPEHCEVIKGGHCTVCTRKCPVSDHVKEQKIYVNKTRRVQKTVKEMKEKYEKNKAECEKKSSLLENLEKEMKDLTAEKTRWLEESYQHVVSLEQIALNVDSVSTHVHLDFLIEKMKEKGDTEKVQKLEEMKRRQDEGTRAVLRYMFGKLAAGKPVKETF